jgi:hypothetical protein
MDTGSGIHLLVWTSDGLCTYIGTGLTSLDDTGLKWTDWSGPDWTRRTGLGTLLYRVPRTPLAICQPTVRYTLDR